MPLNPVFRFGRDHSHLPGFPVVLLAVAGVATIGLAQQHALHGRAVGVLHAAHSLGATVPDRLSVVGFDDILISGHTVPALTTSRMPTTKIVSYAINLAVGLARDPQARHEPSIEIFAPELIIRDSTARPARRRR